MPSQDPTDGVLLLAYTPRPPSLETESMLRCAYRAGLSGEKLDGGWNRACSRDYAIRGDDDDDDDGSDDDDEEKDDDADADGFVNNRSSRDCPGGRERTAVNSITGSRDDANGDDGDDLSLIHI